jgi:hypothetical protein
MPGPRYAMQKLRTHNTNALPATAKILRKFNVAAFLQGHCAFAPLGGSEGLIPGLFRQAAMLQFERQVSASLATSHGTGQAGSMRVR